MQNHIELPMMANSIPVVQHREAYTRDNGSVPERGVCDELPPSPKCRPVAWSLPDSTQTSHHHGIRGWRLSASGTVDTHSPSSQTHTLSSFVYPPPTHTQLVHVDKTVLSESQIASLATDICRGLQYLHSINVLHRLLLQHLPLYIKGFFYKYRATL